MNHYGVMPDAINVGDETDRMILRWELDSPATRAACDGADPRPASNQELIMVEIPGDIESLRRSDPALAGAWRVKLRDQLVRLLSTPGSSEATLEALFQATQGNTERLRRQARGGSPAFESSDEPLLDYLMGDDR